MIIVGQVTKQLTNVEEKSPLLSRVSKLSGFVTFINGGWIRIRKCAYNRGGMGLMLGACVG